jgi:hypothetical protein
MKRLLTLVFCFGLATALTVHAEDKNKKKNANKAAVAAQHHAAVSSRQNVRVQRGVQARNVNLQHHANVQRNVAVQRNVNVQRSQINAAKVQQARVQQAKVRQANNAAALRSQRVHNQNAAFANQNARIANQNARITQQNRRIAAQNVTVRNRNSWYQARQFNWHHRHDRSWWHHNYPSTRFVIFGGGYYFWNNGYWYPAYGYDPGYSTYQFDEPIYGPNQSDPGRVISDVQVQLQREGYYHGDVDGLIGPMTRRALAAYQADHGLYVTRAIDEPTLEALGLA